MRAADLMPQLMELLAANPDAVVCVFDGKLATKPASCAPDCVYWQDAAMFEPVHVAACNRFRLRFRHNMSVDRYLCVTCGHPRQCHVGEVRS